MAHHEVLDTNPKKELMTATLGIGLFLALVLGIVVSAYLRPAGDHYPATTEAPVVAADGAKLAEPNATQSGADTTAPVNADSSTTSPATAKAVQVADAPKDSPVAPSGQTESLADPQADKK